MSLTASQSDGSPTISERQRPQKNERELGTLENAIFVIEYLVATTVLWFLAACEFSVRSYLQPPWLVGLEPVVKRVGKHLEIGEEPSILVGDS
jgi:hypothetical protein